MKNILFFLAFLLCVCMRAQSLRGIVKSKATGESLPGAVIFFPDLKMGVSSLADGSYQVKNLPKIKILVQVKLIGFKTLIKKIDLETENVMDFELEESVIEEDEIIVTGTSRATEIKKNPVPMVSIDQKYLSQNSSNNIIEAIARVPGISVLSTGPNISKPYIRGLGYNRVLTLFDGVRQDGQQWGDEHGIEVDQFLIDRIEVIKGPASLIYGSDALAGVVNLLPANPSPAGNINGRLLTSYQTNNGQMAGSFDLEGNTNRITWGFRFSKKMASDYQNRYDGRVYGTKYNETDINAHIGINRNWGYSYLNFSYYDNLQEVPDGYRDSASRKFVKQISEEDTLRPIVSNNELANYNIATLHQHVRHFRAHSTSSFHIGKSRLALRLGNQQSIREEFSHPKYPKQAGLSLELSTSTYDVKYYLPEIKGSETVFGVNGMLQQNNNITATEFVIPDYKSFDVGPFAHVKKSLGKLELSAGIRYDLRNFRNFELYTTADTVTGFDRQTTFKAGDTTQVKQFDNYTHTFSGFSGSFGGTYSFSEKLAVKANIGRGYRAPNISEISAKGIHPGTGFLQLGDANFKPEFNLQEDLGIFFETEHVSGSVEVFNNLVSNYIYNEKLLSRYGNDSLFEQNGNFYPVFKFRQTKAQLYGGEFSLDIHPHPLDWLHIENSASFILATNLGGNGSQITDSTKYLPFIPPFHTSTVLRASFRKKRGCFANIFVKAGLQFYATQNRIYSAYGTETKTPGYVLLDGGLGADIVNRKGKTLFTLSITGNNLADVAYQNNMSRLKYFDNYPLNGTGRSGIYSMGRNISFRLVIPLMIKEAK
jgi:iron complex outermembrane recepter protein